MFTFTQKNLSELLVEQRVKSNEQRAKSNEHRAKSNEQQAESNEKRANSNEQRAKSNEQGATSEKFHLGWTNKIFKAKSCSKSLQ